VAISLVSTGISAVICLKGGRETAAQNGTAPEMANRLCLPFPRPLIEERCMVKELLSH
jgi:hypothetical protein